MLQPNHAPEHERKVTCPKCRPRHGETVLKLPRNRHRTDIWECQCCGTLFRGKNLDAPTAMSLTKDVLAYLSALSDSSGDG